MSDRNHASPERITVTYAASQAVINAPLTPHFVHLLREQLPLRNLHWRPSQSTLDAIAARAAQQGKTAYTSSSVVPGSTIRTIQTLDVALKPLTDEIRRWRGDPGFFEQPGGAGLLDRPFVHLYLVVCEDSEHYRTTVRNEIRSWISSLSFFHSKQAVASAGTPTLASSSRTSLGLGSFRSGTPPVRSETPPIVPSSSGRNTPTSSSVSTKASSNTAAYSGPSEPEYLIVLITPPEGSGIRASDGPSAAGADAKTGMSRFMNKSKGNVLEKIRADFNTSKKEHVVQLSRLPPVPSAPLGRAGMHSMDPTIWAELLTKMREAASSTFTTTIEAQEEEIARCGVTKAQQGWDFCSYFFAKDSLARTLEAVGLKDDAVGQYEDLEIVFASAMQSGAVSFAPVGGDDPDDDSLPLLDVTKKPYAELIRRREISLFDFRCYLFARKSALLGKMGRVAAVMREAPIFISAVGRMLKRNRGLSSQWIESWIFSAALDVVEQCQAWLIQRGGQSSVTADDQLSPAFQSNKSELLDVARRQLDRIGVEAGHLPASEPFAFATSQDSIHNSSAQDRELPLLPDATDSGAVEGLGLGAAVTLGQQRGTSRPELQQAVKSREHFDSYYLALCQRILSGWKASSRTRDVLRIRNMIATLHYVRGNYQTAYDILVSLKEAYAESKFTLLEGHALAMQLECHAKLNHARDRAWIAAALALLKISVLHPISTVSIEGRTAQWLDPAHLCAQLRPASTSLGKEIPISAFPLFSISLSTTTATLAQTEDGSILHVDVTSLLPCVQTVEDVRICLTRNSETQWYTSSSTKLAPGVTRVELFCPNPIHGVYTVDVTQIRLARLIFQYEHASEPLLVRVSKDAEAPSVRVELPRQIDLDRGRAMEVTVRAGRAEIQGAEISVVSSDDAAVVDYYAARCDGGPGNTAETSVSIQSLGKDSEIVVLLPLLSVPDSGVLDAIVILTYTTAASSRHASAKKRMLKQPIHLRTALPLGVNVQDFFRTSCLFSKFTISAGGGGSIRLRPVAMVHDEGHDGSFTIDSSGSKREVTVTPRQPATYLFRIAKSGGGKGRLRLEVEYRALQDDAVAAAVRALHIVVRGTGLKEMRLLEEALVEYVRERLDLPAYSITGQVRTGVLDEGWWRRERRSWGPSSLGLDEVLGLVQSALDAIPTSQEKGEEVWQKLTIPVDVPTIDYVNAVTLSVASPATIGSTDPTPSELASLIVGQPVELTVSIRTSTLWSNASTDEEESMLYDVLPDFDSWLVDGSKRGTFPLATTKQASLSTLREDATFSVTLTIVPLRTGELALPSVQVRPLSSVVPQPDGRARTCETYVTNAAQRVTVVPAKGVKAFFVPMGGKRWSMPPGAGLEGGQSIDVGRQRYPWPSQQLHAA
ncbi:TRAPP II complex, TRAPPC10 [Kalmanozyma brasiliensis GHG001]|uniref:Trafficking protein particle complex subunit 11 domain-containing protein n=1 Tax=Kalmanozyma brasiliensis (strain GHG001) TaxID=1365824 RepID=V5GIA2_KALBG|nr:TRAPP II complex, TRAPPC10 [Kalmanozyma brasiliensis GHG001]EST05702.1 TRAPP II complex, TRAPPC10 [Kalmanozyma brasiliensis GHG001]